MASTAVPPPAQLSDLLFDVDGVLVSPAFRFRDHLESAHGITPEMTAPFFRGRFIACLTGHAELADELEVYLRGWGCQGTPESFIAKWLCEDSNLDPSMLDLVAELRSRGYQCHVASVQETNRAEYLRETLGFNQVFDKTFFSCDLGAAKPDPAFYGTIRRQLSRLPHELFLVDDSVACVDAARAAGWNAFLHQGPDDRTRLLKTILEHE